MAGGGEVIPNGSIHWNVNHDNGNKAPYNKYLVQGVDPTPVADIRRDSKEHPGNFQVTLRFKSIEAAKRALASATIRKNEKTKLIEVVVFVPPTGVTVARATGATPNPYAQVRIDW